MALSYKDIVITPNKSSSTDDPKIVFSGANSSVNTDITLKVYPTSNGTLSFEGSAGQLFSLTNDLSSELFSVGDISGIPVMDITSSGQMRLFPFNSSGYVGIGTTNPVVTLDVNGTLNVSGGAYLAGVTISSGVSNYGSSYVYGGSVTNYLKVAPSASPTGLETAGSYLVSDLSGSTSVTEYCAEFLTSLGTVNAGRCLWSQGSTYGLGLFLGSTGGTGGYAYWQWVTRATGAVISTPITISSITATPKVGIANTNPGHTLAVTGSLFASGDLTLMGGADGIQLNNATSNYITWGTAGTAAPVVGTTRSTGTKLVLYPNATASSSDYSIGIASSTMWFNIPDTAQYAWYVNTTARMVLTSAYDLQVRSGSILCTTGTAAAPGIGFYGYENVGMWRSATDNLSFTVNGVNQITITPISLKPAVNNRTYLGATDTRFATLYTISAVNVLSDERVKTDIANTRLGLDFINSLRPVEYKMKVGECIPYNDPERGDNGMNPSFTTRPGKRTHFGLIAQEVKQALPEDLNFGGWCLANSADPDSEQSLLYEEFMSPMIKAIQELSYKVDEIKVELNQLRANN